MPPGASSCEERSGIRSTAAAPHEGQTNGFWSLSAAISISASGARYSVFQGGPALLNLAVSRKYGVAPETGDALQLSLLRIR